MLNKKLLKILCCPKCKSTLKEKGMFLVCNDCDLAYPILDKTVPDLLIDDAKTLAYARKIKFKHKLKLE